MRPPLAVVVGSSIPVLIILVIFIVVLISVLTYSSYKIYKEPGGISRLFLECPAGQCATNIYNGEKRCPASTDVILYDPMYEVCNSKYLCDNNMTPFALKTDGSTDQLGICDDNTPCRCLKSSRCPEHCLTVFKSVNGSPEDLLDKSRYVFEQIPIPSASSTGVTPVTVQNPDTEFCGIKVYHANRLAQGACDFTESEFNIDPISTSIKCFESNPCIVGSFVLNPPDPQEIETNGVSTSMLYSIPATCAPGNSWCPNTDFPIPYWHAGNAKIECAALALED